MLVLPICILYLLNTCTEITRNNLVKMEIFTSGSQMNMLCFVYDIQIIIDQVKDLKKY